MAGAPLGHGPSVLDPALLCATWDGSASAQAATHRRPIADPNPSSAQVFTTAHAGQQEASLLLYAGNDARASRNLLLGQVHLRGLPSAPAGRAKIEARAGLGFG